MTEAHLVVDGSNIATEGRTAPSLAQLNEAVIAFTKDHTFDNVVVVVDATFPNRIDQSERDEFEAAVLAGEILTPPAGAVGRGDAFVLQIANRTDATILSNDSFQEFHGTYAWLFDEDRLFGGKPVPGVGWVFVARVPVRGAVSRRAQRDAGRKKQAAPTPAPAGRKRSSKAAASSDAPAKRSRKSKAAAATAAPAEREPTTSSRRRPRAGGDPINAPAEFLAFVTAHQPGATIEGEVIEFASHGAYVSSAGARCYLGLKSMSDPPPRSPRDVLQIGEVRSFIVQGFDTPRRGIDLALPGTDHVDAGTSTPPRSTAASRGPAGGGNHQQPTLSGEPSEEEAVAVKKKAPAKRKAAAKKKAPAKRKAAAKKKAPAKRKAAAKKKAPAKRKAAAKKKAPAKRKAAAKRKAPARRR